MPKTTVSVSAATRDRLAGLKRGDETYDDVLGMLIDEHEREPDLAAVKPRAEVQ